MRVSLVPHRPHRVDKALIPFLVQMFTSASGGDWLGWYSGCSFFDVLLVDRTKAGWVTTSSMSSAQLDFARSS